MDEQQLVKALKKGEAAAYTMLVSEYQHIVYRTALNILQHATDAEDVTQEVFMTVFRSVKNFREEAGITTWLYRIAINQCLEWQRHKNRKKRFAQVQSLDTAKEETISFHVPNFDHPGVRLENKERASILFAAINHLPDLQKTTFLLHSAEQLSYAEIAVIIETTVPSVESLLVRARRKLRILLADYYHNHEKTNTNT